MGGHRGWPASGTRSTAARARDGPSKPRKAERDLARFEPGRVLRLKYEDFVENPLSDLERICAHCDLAMTDEMVRAAKDLVKSDRQTKWRRFDPHELARLLPDVPGNDTRLEPFLLVGNDFLLKEFSEGIPKDLMFLSEYLPFHGSCLPLVQCSLESGISC